ncbi:heme-binding protein [Ligilactobacillus salivarius]
MVAKETITRQIPALDPNKLPKIAFTTNTKNRRKVYFRSGKNTSSENNMWINKKLNTVEAFDHSTFYKKAVYAGNEAKFYQDTGFSPKEFTIGGGGFPIFVKDVGIVGSLIISGLTDFEDHQLAYDSLISLKKEL